MPPRAGLTEAITPVYTPVVEDSDHVPVKISYTAVRHTNTSRGRRTPSSGAISGHRLVGVGSQLQEVGQFEFLTDTNAVPH